MTFNVYILVSLIIFLWKYKNVFHETGYSINVLVGI